MAARLEADPFLVDVVKKNISGVNLDSIQPDGPKGRFQIAKKRLRAVHCLLDKEDIVSNEQIKSLIGLILTSTEFRKEYKAILGIGEAAEGEVPLHLRFTSAVTGTFSRFGDWLRAKDPSEARKAYRDFFDHSPLSDHEYLNFLRRLKADQPAFSEVIDEIFVMAHQYIANALSHALKGQLPDRLQLDMNEREKQELSARCKRLAAEDEARSWGALKDQVIQDLGASNEQYARIWFYSFFCSRDICPKAQDRHRTSKEAWFHVLLGSSMSVPCDHALVCI